MYLAARLVTARSIFRGMTFMKKQAAMIAICAALLMSVAAAGCTSSTSPSPSASVTATSSSHAATASVTATPTPIASVTATPTPIASATATLTPTATPTPGSAGHATVSALPGCPYCAADIANLRAQGYAVTVLYPGDPGFVNNATSYPVIQYG
jgi:hypothetical protein